MQAETNSSGHRLLTGNFLSALTFADKAPISSIPLRGRRCKPVWLAAVFLLATVWGCGPRTPLTLPAMPPPMPGEVTLPGKPNSVRFAVIGDSGTGREGQYEVARQMVRFHKSIPYDFVLMLGDNMYGGEGPEDFVLKFEAPYAGLLQAGVRFYASLGNHDEPEQIHFPGFNMNSRRYYSFQRGDATFYALDTTHLDPGQLEWLERELRSDAAHWKVAFFHHPLYSSGRRHGSDLELRSLLEPLFIRYGLDVVLAGHDHFYERIRPQNGVHYFVSGAAATLRAGNIRVTPMTASGFDQDQHFMIFEINGSQIDFQVISRVGATVDSGTIRAGNATINAADSRGSFGKSGQ